MCVPAVIPIAMAAVSAAGTAASYYGQQQAADAQSEYGKNIHKYVKKTATANYYQQVQQIQTRFGQETTRAGDESMKNTLAGEKAKAQAAAVFGERGVTGNSINSLLGDFDRIEAQNHSPLATNLNWQKQQAGQDILAARANAIDRIHGSVPQPVAYPSLLAAALQLGGTALKAYDSVQFANRSGVYDQGNPNVPQRPLSTLIG
jgi:hypothetical protein